MDSHWVPEIASMSAVAATDECLEVAVMHSAARLDAIEAHFDGHAAAAAAAGCCCCCDWASRW